MTGIDTSGMPQFGTPAYSQVSGTPALAPVATSGSYTDLANQPTLGSLAALSSLPVPTASSLGGVESFTAPASQWLNAISTAGAVSSSQPAFSDISGKVGASQLPAATASALGGVKPGSNITVATDGTISVAAPYTLPAAGTALGGVQAATAGSNQFMTGISTSGVPQFAQPAYSGLSGLPLLGTLASLSSVNNTNWSGTPLAIGNGGTGQTSANAAFNALSPMTTAGDIIYGGTSGAATRLGAGTAGLFLQSQGSGNAPVYAAAPSLATSAVNVYPSAGTGTIGAALATASQEHLGLGSSYTINLAAGTYNENNLYASQQTSPVSLLGTTLTKTLSSVYSVSGSSGVFSVALALTSVSGISTGQYVGLYGLTGPNAASQSVMQGCWPITAVDTVNNRITCTVTTDGTTPATGTYSGTCYILQSIINVSSGMGLGIYRSYMTLGGFVVVGNSSGVGLGVNDAGIVYQSAPIGIVGCGTGLLVQNASTLDGSYPILCSNNTVGVQVTTNGKLGTNIVTSGNSGNGVVISFGGIANVLSSSMIAGNQGIGMQLSAEAKVSLGAIVIRSNAYSGVYADDSCTIIHGTETITGNNDWSDLGSANFVMKPARSWTSSTIPTASLSAGVTLTVSDGVATPGFGATYSGGGSTSRKVTSDGTNWVYTTYATPLTLAAGTSSQAPLTLTSGTNLTSAAAGAIEYDGSAFYASPLATTRNVVDTCQYVFVETAVSLSNATGAQSPLPSGSQNFAITANTYYEFEGNFLFSTGTTSHALQTGFSLGGSAAVSNLAYSALGAADAVTGLSSSVSGVTLTSVTAAGTGATGQITIKGTFKCTTSGTIAPQVAFSAAPGGTNAIAVGSSFKLWTRGASAAQGKLS